MAEKGLYKRIIVRLAQMALLLLGSTSLALNAQPVVPAPAFVEPSYSDLATFIDPAELVLRVKVRKQSVVEPERAPGLRPGWARLYLEARVIAVLAGHTSISEDVHYLVDVSRRAKGKPPKLKGTSAILFAREVAGRPGELQLVGNGAHLPADPALEARLQPILAEFFSVDAPPRIVRIRDVLWVPGNLAGESETQLFLATTTDVPALISVIRQPGRDPVWGVSWSELAEQTARPPDRDTISWFRLACFLPPRLPAAAQLSADPYARDQAERDYQLVRRDLGKCSRKAE